MSGILEWLRLQDYGIKIIFNGKEFNENFPLGSKVISGRPTEGKTKWTERQTSDLTILPFMF